MEVYYRRFHPEYRPAPPSRSDCRSAAAGPGALSIVYAENDSKICVPVELDSTVSLSAPPATSTSGAPWSWVT